MTTLKRLMSMLLAGLVALVVAPPAAAQDPAMAANNTWISLSGTVEKVSPDLFTLDYGDGTIRVEMDDGDRDADAYKLIAGDKVTVNGVIDADFFQARTIEASSVFVENLGTTFYSSAIDEEDPWVVTPGPIVVPASVLEGTVARVEDDQFILATGPEMIQVNVDEMPYDPLDDEGYQKVRVGDRVRVAGEVDWELFEGNVFDATAIMTLARHPMNMK